MAKVSSDTGKIKHLLCDPQTVLAALGLLDSAKRPARGLISCPVHSDSRPSCSIRVGSDGTLAVNCFGCDFRGDVFTLIAAVRGLTIPQDFPQVVKYARMLCGGDLSAPLPSRQRRPAPPDRRPPPPAEVRELWALCSPIAADPDLARQLQARAIDPKVIDDRDLARALPNSGPLPRWARGESRSWREKHRCILRLWNVAGEMVSAHARAIEGTAEATKGLLPAGHSARGLFLADAFALTLLKQGIPTWWRQPDPPRILIAEGGIDFLTVASSFDDSESNPAVLGILAGSWSDALAERIPSGCPVVVLTHADNAGAKYRDLIAASVWPRCPVYVGGLNHG